MPRGAILKIPLFILQHLQKHAIKIKRFILLSIPIILFASDDKPLPIGNFSLPSISQIAPLISFGQLLVGKNALLVQLTGDYIRGEHSYANIFLPDVIYGIRDDLSIALFVPFNIKSRSGLFHSSGIEDMILQLEYGYYSKSTKYYTMQGTVLGNVQFPTGSSKKNPPTGTGTFSYFLGTTFNFVSINWYAFVSPGVHITMSHHGTKFGNSYLYQWGMARYIKWLSPPGWIFDVMVEFDGTYSEKNTVYNVTNPNSGGNILFVTPSIWLSSKRWIFQWGVGIPLIQDLNGHQNKIHYSLDYILGIAFQF